MTLVVVEVEAAGDEAAARAARLIDDYLESMLAKGLLKYRIARSAKDPAKMMLFEEWSDRTAFTASITGHAAFDAFQRELAPLLAVPPKAGEFEIVAAGIAGE